jgi:aldehyde dehydrogenase (NAD+)
LTLIPHEYDELLVAGRWVRSSGDQRIRVHNPATLELVGSCPKTTTLDATAAVTMARRTFDDGFWSRQMTWTERAAHLDKLAAVLEDAYDDLTELIVHEMGSPVRWARPRQVPHPVAIAKLYADLGRAHGIENVRSWSEPGLGRTTRVVRQPAGVVAAITPWNMPLKTIMMKVAPALLAGCTVIVKPAPETPLNAIAFAALATIAGLPDGVLTVLPGGDELGQFLVTHPDVDKVAFTGSTAAGRQVAERCGYHMQRVSLELGGKSPAILLPDADEPTVEAMVSSLRDDMFGNSGQVCSAHTRVLVPEHLHDRVARMVADMAESLVLGDPLDEQTDVGPLVSETQRRRVLSYIDIGVREGANLLCGGGVPSGLIGWFVQPSVFAGVDNRMRIAQEEIFGPVVCVIPYQDEDDAIRIANDSPYGLEAAVWTPDLDHARRIAGRLRVGTVRVNGTDPGLDAPLGGFKLSGIGRELGREGLEHYTEPQTVAVPYAG